MFLADESCDFAVVRALREAGFDVTAVSEVWPGAVDDVVFDLAICEGRMVITEKKTSAGSCTLEEELQAVSCY